MSLSECWHIWVCRCPGVFWAKRPQHYTCAECGALIRQIEVVRR